MVNVSLGWSSNGTSTSRLTASQAIMRHYRRFPKGRMASLTPPFSHPLPLDSLAVSLAAGFSIFQAKDGSTANLGTRKPGTAGNKGHTDPRMPQPRGMNFAYNFSF